MLGKCGEKIPFMGFMGNDCWCKISNSYAVSTQLHTFIILPHYLLMIYFRFCLWVELDKHVEDVNTNGLGLHHGIVLPRRHGEEWGCGRKYYTSAKFDL